jgi:hypothetical protein
VEKTQEGSSFIQCKLSQDDENRSWVEVDVKGNLYKTRFGFSHLLQNDNDNTKHAYLFAPYVGKIKTENVDKKYCEEINNGPV